MQQHLRTLLLRVTTQETQQCCKCLPDNTLFLWFRIRDRLPLHPLELRMGSRSKFQCHRLPQAQILPQDHHHSLKLITKQSINHNLKHRQRKPQHPKPRLVLPVELYHHNTSHRLVVFRFLLSATSPTFHNNSLSLLIGQCIFGTSRHTLTQLTWSQCWPHKILRVAWFNMKLPCSYLTLDSKQTSSLWKLISAKLCGSNRSSSNG